MIGNTYEMMKSVPVMIFYIMILAGMFYLFLDINIISSMKLLSFSLLKLWIPLILFGVGLDVIYTLKIDKLKRSLLKI